MFNVYYIQKQLVRPFQECSKDKVRNSFCLYLEIVTQRYGLSQRKAIPFALEEDERKIDDEQNLTTRLREN